MTVATYGNVPAVAAFDSGNLLAVATALHERWPDKGIMIAGDDDHKLENNPGRVKALEAAAAVNALAVFPQLSAEQREQGMTDLPFPINPIGLISKIIKQNQGFEISRLLDQQREQEQHPGIDR